MEEHRSVFLSSLYQDYLVTATLRQVQTQADPLQTRNRALNLC